MKTPRKPRSNPRPKPKKGHDFQPEEKNGAQPADITTVAQPSTSTPP